MCPPFTVVVVVVVDDAAAAAVVVVVVVLVLGYVLDYGAVYGRQLTTPRCAVGLLTRSDLPQLALISLTRELPH